MCLQTFFSSTSDSSVYYTKRRSRLDIQNILEEKAVNLFLKKSHHTNSNDPSHALYASIDKKKKRKEKLKRKYLSENRVGSVEGLKLNSSQSSSGSDAFDITSKMPHYYEPVEAINPNVIADHQQQYNRNKLLHSDNVFTIRSAHNEDEEVGQFESPTETYNRNVLRALQRDTRSPGAGSIGSFLSMVSVRSFPKCSVPEPLSRVLEPLSVMHLDQSDEGHPRTTNKAPPRVINTIGTGITTTVDIEQHNDDGHLYRSQSDGADPGVIGPVVWEIHKKQIEQNGDGVNKGA